MPPSMCHSAMTNCPELLVLQSYVDGELAADEARAVAGHLEECPECRRIVSSMQGVRAALGATAQVAPPSRLFVDIQAAVATGGHGLACDQAHEIISAALDDELSPEQATALDDHLRECPDCRYYAQRLGLVTKLLREVEPVAPAAGLRARIEAAVDRAAGYAAISRILNADFRRKLGVTAGLAAAAAIMLVVALHVLPVAGPPQLAPSPPPETIASAPSPHPEPVAATATEAEAEATQLPQQPTVAATLPAARDTAGTHRPAEVAPTRTPRGEPAVRPTPAAPAPALAEPQPPQAPAVGPSKAVAVVPLVGARPVTIARRSETPPAAMLPPRAGTTAEASIETPIKMVIIPQPEATPPPAHAEATLAKARPSTPASLRSTEAERTSAGVRLASAGASWLPVTEAPRSVYRSAAASSERLAGASERISKEIDDIKRRGLASPGIVVIQ